MLKCQNTREMRSRHKSHFQRDTACAPICMKLAVFYNCSLKRPEGHLKGLKVKDTFKLAQ